MNARDRLGSDGLARLRAYMARAGVVALALFCLFALWRFAGESDRFSARLDETVRQLEVEITSDCAFKRKIALLPALTLKAGRPLTASLVELATSARAAYRYKRCEQAVDPETGRPYGPAPPVYKATVP